MISLSSVLFLIIALLVVSFLIFIHELGHYWMARRVGMKVDTFSIGIGKPIYSWEHDGVKWQICWILFGGYVRIAGEDSEEELEETSAYSSQSLARPFQEGGTFQSKSPL